MAVKAIGKVCAYEKKHGITLRKDNVVSEGLEIALIAEKRDQMVYAEAASETRSYALKELFTMLATEELHHIEVLSSLKECLKANGKWAEFKRKSAKLPVSIALAAEQAAQATGDEVEVIIAAMKAEKDSETFYLKLASLAPSKQGRDFFKQLAANEASHFELLDKLFQEIEDSEVKISK